MSTHFYVAPYDPKEWEESEDWSKMPTSSLRIDAVDYARKLEERWPTAQIHLPEFNPNIALWCILPLPTEITGNFGGQRLNLLRNLQVVALEGGGYDEGFQGFLLWHRAYVSKAYRLWFSCSSSRERLELKPNTTEDDIVIFRKKYQI
jgi:hypothetical protein